LVVGVKRPEKLSLLTDQSQFGGGRPGVDAQITVPPVVFQRGGFDFGPAVPVQKGLVIFRPGE
jgi:hypothetical protein